MPESDYSAKLLANIAAFSDWSRDSNWTNLMTRIKKEPLVSIIMPVHNGEKYLEEAVISIINQNYSNWELIIVNDFSTDSTASIISRYAKEDKRIRVITHRSQKYRSGALNTGIRLARGKFISFLDADDIYFPNKTAKQISFLAEHPEISLVYSDMEIFDASGKKELRHAIDFKKDPKQVLLEVSEQEITPNTSAFTILAYGNDYRGIPSCSVLIRKKVFADIGLDENLKTSQDYDLWFQIIGRGFKIARLPILAYRYRHHPEQITRTKNHQTNQGSYNRIIKKLKNWEYFKIPGKTKPKILLIPNVPNWAFDSEADELIKRFSNRYDFTKKYHVDFAIGYKNYSKYDKILVFFWPAARNILNRLPADEAKEKLIAGVFSFNSWQGRKKEAKDIFSRCRGVAVNNKRLQKEFSSDKYQTYYVPKWVDAKMFKPLRGPRRKDGKLIVGWAGNADHHGKSYKGYWEILLSVCERNKDWITLKSALKHNQIPFDKMPEFYNSIDLITCLSKNETGPNSLLEAGACGKPAISVKVGVAEELIKNHGNGLLIERSQKSLEKALRQLYNDKEELKRMGRRMRQEILKNWTCERNIRAYKKIFD